MSSNKTWAKIGLLLIIIAAIFAFFHFDLGASLNLDTLKLQRAELSAYVDANLWTAIAIFFVVYVLVTALSLPGAAILTLAGGAIFGLLTGLVVVSFASSMGALLSFLSAGFLLRQFAKAFDFPYVDKSDRVRSYLIDGIAFARSGGHLDAHMLLSESERVVDQLIGDLDASIDVSLDGGRDAGGWHFLDMSLKTTLVLQCQRCLGEIAYGVDINRRLRLVKSEAEISDDDLSDESLDVIVAAQDMSVIELVEEEILLELPMVAMHENCSSALP